MSNIVKGKEVEFDWSNKLKNLIKEKNSGEEFTAESLTKELLKEKTIVGNASVLLTEKFLKTHEGELVRKNPNDTYSKI
ncbi:hypothetical protein ACFY5J_28700 [Peribacillus butanolivorans]|uniref:hypothetical protein n=1 Tax=Peribacillus butanolivorans TaxID=421767 RepID=UPI0036BBD4FF